MAPVDSDRLRELVIQLKNHLELEQEKRKTAEDLAAQHAKNFSQIYGRMMSQVEAHARQAAELDYLHSVMQIGSSTLPTQDALSQFILLSCRLGLWSMGHVWLPNPDNPSQLLSSNVWFLAEPQKGEPFKALSGSTVFSVGQGIPGMAAQLNSRFELSDFSSNIEPQRGGLLQNLGMTWGMAIPILLNDKLTAVIEFFSAQNTPENAAVIEFVDAGSRQLSALLQRMEQEAKLSEQFESLKKAQLQLVQSEKMASLGMIAAGVAHEINNPMSFILSNVRSLARYKTAFNTYHRKTQDTAAFLESLPDPLAQTAVNDLKQIAQDTKIEFLLGDLDKLISETSSGIDRIKDIVAGLKTFSHVDQAEEKKGNINECIEATLKVIWNELKYKCTLEKDLGPLPQIYCRAGQLIQVFTNLLVNAAHAIPEKGVIKIKTWSTAQLIFIEISDNGCGISKENLKNLFTPFFTTKPVGKGTGLGLSISYGIIQQHGGTIEVQSEEGQGTRFTIQIPIKE